MKKLSFFAAALLLFSVAANATIRRVGYNGVARTGVDYADIAAAQTASAAGDTIQIYGTISGSTSIRKRLVIIGFGYNYDVNFGLQAIGGDAPSVANLTFSTGSDSSILEGMRGTWYVGNDVSTSIGIAVSKVIIRRCMGTVYLYNVYGPVNDTKIIDCVTDNINMWTNATQYYPAVNTQIYNSYISSVNMYMAGSSGSIINCVTVSPTYTGSNISLNNAGFLVKNSIIGNYRTDNSNTVYESNFFGTAQPATLPPGSNNRWGQVWANLFARTAAGTELAGWYADATFTESYFVLKSGSAAINGGTDSGGNPTDAGIYGGDALYRYKLSGVPAVPAIYKLTAPSTAASTNPYNITVSVRSNN